MMQKQNAPFLQNIYDTCKQIGIVNSQYEFSALCGRRSSWFAASKTRDKQISTHAAYTLAVRLKEMAQGDLPRTFRPHANALAGLLLALINERAKLKK